MASDLAAVIKLTTVHVELIKLLAEIAVEDYLREREKAAEAVQLHHEEIRR